MTRRLTSFLEAVIGLLPFLLLPIGGCWMSAGWGGPGNGTDTDSDSDTDSDTVTDWESETEGCDEQDIPVYNDPARVLILQDHSSSMAGGNWDIARNAIYNLLATFADTSLEFGLDALPDADVGDCQASAPVIIDCGPDTEGGIHAALADMSTFVSTPLYDALHNFLNPEYAPGCTDTEYSKHILLVADGEESCSAATTDDFIELTNDLVSAGIKVIVVGFNVNMSSEQLDAIAAHGGTEFTTYLNATDAPSLNAALDTIATSIDSCVFSIDAPEASASPGLVNFYFDGEVAPMDEDCSSDSGWRWADEDHTQVEFCPDSCEQLKNGTVGELSAKFGCPTVSE
jgi:hypothetical protein